MIKDFDELGITGEETLEQIDALLQDKLGINHTTMAQALSKYLQDQAEQVAIDFTNVAPRGDYSQLLEDQDDIARFFREQACQVDNWEPRYLLNGEKNLIQVSFSNSAVDDGNTMEGHVFVSFSGVIRHAFVQGDE